MASTFPQVRRRQVGYDIDQVESFLAIARAAYAADAGEQAEVTSEVIRRTAFDTRRGGYSTSHVDAALERLEDAFAERERDALPPDADADAEGEREGERDAEGEGENEGEREGDGGSGAARTEVEEVCERLARPSGTKFRRAGVFRRGYRRRDVDSFAAEVVAHFRNERELQPADVRAALFRASRNGYSEAQVDLVLDRVVGLLLAAR